MSSVKALECSINGTGVEIFSIYRENNTHIGAPGYYPTKFTCDVISATIRSSCLEDEQAWFSIYRENNTHIGAPTYYTYFLCVKPKFFCYVNTTGNCASGETALFSVYRENNTHIGTLGYYQNVFCCKPISVGEWFSRYTTDQLIFIEFKEKKTSLLKDKTETVFLADSSIKKAFSVRDEIEDVYFVDSSTKKTSLLKDKTEDILLFDFLSKKASFNKFAESQISLLDNGVKIFSGIRASIEHTKIFDFIARKVSLSKFTAESLSIYEAIIKRLGFSRFVQQSISIIDEASGFLEFIAKNFIRTAKETINFIDNAISSIPIKITEFLYEVYKSQQNLVIIFSSIVFILAGLAFVKA